MSAEIKHSKNPDKELAPFDCIVRISPVILCTVLLRQLCNY